MMRALVVVRQVGRGRAFSTRAVTGKVQDELATVLDRYRTKGYFGSFQSFTVSTLAVVQLRKEIPGFGIPSLKEDAAKLFCGVGEALADADKRRLQRLTTPMCYSTMSSSLRSRPLGEKHSYRAFDAVASVKQVRVGHHASNPNRRFAQATCIISAKVIWTIKDAKGKLVGGVGNLAVGDVFGREWPWMVTALDGAGHGRVYPWIVTVVSVVAPSSRRYDVTCM